MSLDITAYTDEQGLIVQAPRPDAALLDLVTRDVAQALASAGFVVFRGFAPDLDEFSQFVKRFSRKVTLDPARTFHGGDVAQKVDAGTAALGLHIENGNSPFGPDLTWFLCERAARRGSQTTVCDGAAVWADATPALIDLFAEQDIVYRRRVEEVKWKQFVAHHQGGTKPISEITVDDIVAQANDAASTEITLHDDGSIEYAYSTRAAHETLFSRNFAWANSILGPSYNYEKPRITFADGRDLTADLLTEVREWTGRHTLEIDWRDGDVALIDNTRVMHGRRAIIDTDRTIYNAQSYIRPDILAEARR